MISYMLFDIQVNVIKLMHDLSTNNVYFLLEVVPAIWILEATRAMVGGPSQSTQWDGDESSTNSSIYSSPLPWFGSSRKKHDAIVANFLTSVMKRKGSILA